MCFSTVARAPFVTVLRPCHLPPGGRLLLRNFQLWRFGRERSRFNIKDLQILICRGVGVYAVYVRCSLFLVGVGAHDDPLSPTNNGTTRKPIKRTTKGRPYNIDGMFVEQATGRRGRRPLQVNAYKVPHKSQFGALCEQCGRLMCLHTRNITLSSRVSQQRRIEWISPSATEREARNVRARTFTDTK